MLAATGIGSGLAMLVLGTAAVPAMAVFGAFLAGLTQATYMAVSQTLLQQVTPDALRGRMISLFFMLARRPHGVHQPRIWPVRGQRGRGAR